VPGAHSAESAAGAGAECGEAFSSSSSSSLAADRGVTACERTAPQPDESFGDRGNPEVHLAIINYVRI
jgi:hypothetical protein